MDYVFTLTDAMIKLLSIGDSPVETVWFWVKGALLFSFSCAYCRCFHLGIRMFIPLQILTQLGITELILGYIAFRIAVAVF
ncbi:MAG: hypothetical protein UZ14_CFX002001161 [Chloroflexi bacterium OLB14]|nr:MAG: hypothetical protein UZ14_CFX002001161 [Chloroflexi bacterium OLB14]